MAEEIIAYMVEYLHNGSATPGWLARPKGRGPYPGVIVIQEWWGLEPHIKDVAERFAREGFVALAPDLYHGVVTDEPDEARKLVMQLNMEAAIREIISGVNYLKRQPFVNGKVGAIGYCLGGNLALMTGVRKGGISAAADYYGGVPDPVDQVKHLECPLLGCFGELDQGIPVANVRRMEEKLKEFGKSTEVHIYSGAGHSFFNDSRAHVYHRPSAEDAWRRTLAFFRRHLT